jgi:hypothetical protein
MAARLAERPTKTEQVVKEIEEDVTEEEEVPEKESIISKVKSRWSTEGEDDGGEHVMSMSPSSRNWVDLIDKTEGGGSYSTLFGHSQKDRFKGVDVSKMTIGQLKSFADPDGAYGQWVKGQVGRVATPMGRYQFVGSTLFKVANELGLNDDVRFSPQIQDKMFDHYLRQRLNRGQTMGEKVDQVRQAWEGFKNVPTMELANLIERT